MNDVSYKPIPVDLVKVDIDQRPVRRKLPGAGIDGNWRSVKDITEYALARRAPVLGYLTMERVDLRECRLRLLQHGLELLTRFSYPVILALSSFPQHLKLALPCFDGDKLMPDLGPRGFESVFIGFVAEEKNIASRRALILALIQVLVGVYWRR